MLNSTTLEVAIGMALVYLLLSLLCTAINEAVAAVLGSRARNLEVGIKSLFTQGLKTAEVKEGNVVVKQALTLTEAIYNHGLVQSLYRSGTGTAAERDFRKFPSYIPSRTFASALLDIVFPDDKAASTGLPKTLAEMLAKLNALPEGKGKEAIQTLVVQADGDIEKVRKAFESWYDDGMDRAAGWYKRNTQRALFILGLILAVTLNINSVSVASSLWNSPALRTYAITAAQDYAKATSVAPKAPVLPGAGEAPQASDLSLQSKAEVSAKATSLYLAELQSLSLPIGWGETSAPWMYHESWGATSLSLLFALAGWLLTAMAVTLGAPFWFDALNQFMVVRSTIKPREKSEVEASKDATTKK